MTCPQLDVLAAAHAAPAEHADVLVHVHGGCVSCGAHWRRLDVFAAAAAGGDFEEVPPHLHAMALEIPQRSRDARPDRFVGRVVFDSAASHLVPGLRDGSAGCRHMLFEAGPYEIDLALIEPSTLVGQVLGPDDTELRDATVLLSGEGRTLQADVLEHGDFRLPGVAVGRYALQITSDDLDLLLPDLDLAPADPDAP